MTLQAYRWFFFSCLSLLIVLSFCLLILVKKGPAPSERFDEKAARVLKSGTEQEMFDFALQIPIDQKLTKAEIELFEVALESASDRVRVLLCTAILRCEHGNRSATESLLSLATSENHWVRVQVACAIEYSSPCETTLKCARILIRDKSPTVRSQVLMSFSHRPNGFPGIGEDVVIAIRQEKDLTVTMWCLKVLACNGAKMDENDISTLYVCLKSHSSHVRRAAIEVIKKVDGASPKAAARLLVLLRDDQDEDVRQTAAECLSVMRLDPSSVTLFVDCLRKENRKLTKAYIVRSLGNQKSHGANGIEELKRLCEDTYLEHDVIDALYSIGGDRADVQEFLQSRLRLANARGDQPTVALLEKITGKPQRMLTPPQ